MIRIVIYDRSENGLFPYRIDGHWGPDGAPLIGISDEPLLEACRVLAALGVPPGTAIGLFDEDRYKTEYRLKTTVGYGAKRTIEETGSGPRVRLITADKPVRKPRRSSKVPKGSGIPGDG